MTWLVLAVIVAALVLTVRIGRIGYRPGGELELSPSRPKPPHVEELEAPTDAALRARGFEVEHEAATYVAGNGATAWVRSWRLPGAPLRAFSSSGPKPAPALPPMHLLIAWTDLPGGRALATTNVAFVSPFGRSEAIDGVRLSKAPADLVVRVHLARIAAASPAPRVEEQRDLATQVFAGDTTALEEGRERGRLRLDGKGRYRFTLRGALHMFKVQLPPWKGRLEEADRRLAEDWVRRLPPETGRLGSAPPTG